MRVHLSKNQERNNSVKPVKNRYHSDFLVTSDNDGVKYRPIVIRIS